MAPRNLAGAMNAMLQTRSQTLSFQATVLDASSDDGYCIVRLDQGGVRHVIVPEGVTVQFGSLVTVSRQGNGNQLTVTTGGATTSVTEETTVTVSELGTETGDEDDVYLRLDTGNRPLTGPLTSQSTLQGTQLISTIAGGTAPLTITSTTVVPNLNADMVDGHHAAYFQIWYNIVNYGADGTLANDDAAVIAAMADMPAGGGVLYFPAGSWPLSATVTLAKPIVVRGDGNVALYNDTSGAVTTITFNSATANCFNVTSKGCAFYDFMLVNAAGSTPSAGAGICVTSNGDQMHYERLTIQGFYDNLDILDGAQWTMHACYFWGARRHDVRIVHTDFAGDFGDWSITDCVFAAGAFDPSGNAIQYESGGGGRITNCKINGWAGGYGFVHGINAAIGTGVVTSILLVENCSIENFHGNGINVATSGTSPFFGLIKITGCEFGPYISNTAGHAVSISAANLGEIEQVVIGNCHFRAATGGGCAMAEAISLAKIDNVFLGGYTINANWTGFLAQSGCTDVIQGLAFDTGTVVDGSYTNTNITLTDGIVTAIGNGAGAAQGQGMHIEVVMAAGIWPPDPVLTPDSTDWIYAWVAD